MAITVHQTVKVIGKSLNLFCIGHAVTLPPVRPRVKFNLGGAGSHFNTVVILPGCPTAVKSCRRLNVHAGKS